MEPTPNDLPPESQLYELHFPRLVAMAVSEFHIPEEEAELLVHDLLVAYLFRPNPPADVESWLNGALKLAAEGLDEVRN